MINFDRHLFPVSIEILYVIVECSYFMYKSKSFWHKLYETILHPLDFYYIEGLNS